ELSPQKDSLILWLTDTSLIKNDTLRFIIRYHRYDSLFNLSFHSDTIYPRYSATKDKMKGKQKMKISANLKDGSAINILSPIGFETSTPISSNNIEKIQLYVVKDTLSIKNSRNIYYKKDSLKKEYADTIFDYIPTAKQANDTVLQRIKAYKLLRNKFYITFTAPISDSTVKVQVIQPAIPENSPKIIFDFETNQNTIIGWVIDTSLFKHKKIELIVTYKSGNKEKKQTIQLKNSNRNFTKQLQLYTFKEQETNLLLDNPLVIMASNPLKSYNDSLISIKIHGDTSSTAIPFTIKKASFSKRAVYLYFNKEKGLQYSIIIKDNAFTDIFDNYNRNTELKVSTQKMTNHLIRTPVETKIVFDSLYPRRFYVEVPKDKPLKYLCEINKAAFTDIYGTVNDSMAVRFSVPTIENFGNLTIDFKNCTGSYIFQIWDKEEKQKLREYSIKNDGDLKVKYLLPTEYKLKVIYDANNNNVWDTGNYKEFRQPEKVVYYPEGSITIKPNWDMKIEWKLE
ncbi:MAG: hypothetical protein SNJ71_01090, partial [Bacteroidales bacterium]